MVELTEEEVKYLRYVDADVMDQLAVCLTAEFGEDHPVEIARMIQYYNAWLTDKSSIPNEPSKDWPGWEH